MIVEIGSSPVYLDTGALAKLYVPERWSDALEEALIGRRDVLVSELAVTELASAIARRMRAGDLSAADGRRVYQRVVRDMVGGEFRRVELTADAHREAERLLMSVVIRTAVRAADALHLAQAVLAGARVLVTFDTRMAEAAEALGTLELPASTLL
jgi:predicted nucleic acid-binding protein